MTDIESAVCIARRTVTEIDGVMDDAKGDVIPKYHAARSLRGQAGEHSRSSEIEREEYLTYASS